ncbi:hypothetical protein AB6A40_000880 [Gnathostoma spinigerum]|uniref:Uncharacterized protein n=1 Tax=Gnathostoma spinigerum TaxID=75299 RepID=A0ABD6E9U3_9BILA
MSDPAKLVTGIALSIIQNFIIPTITGISSQFFTETFQNELHMKTSSANLEVNDNVCEPSKVPDAVSKNTTNLSSSSDLKTAIASD